MFLSSHVLAEVARLATRIGIIHDGRLVDEFPADSLDGACAGRLTVATRDDAGRSAVLSRTATTPHTASAGLC